MGGPDTEVNRIKPILSQIGQLKLSVLFRDASISQYFEIFSVTLNSINIILSLLAGQ